MTALKKYARLEATALWRSGPEAQRREVVVSVGEATLVITDLKSDTALTHWSLAAIERQGSGYPAIFTPDGDPGETLELSANENEMITAIETLRKAVLRARPKPGRLRWLGAALSTAAVAALAFLWLPGALRDHAMRVLPDVKRTEIGDALLSRIARVGGPPCRAPGTENALKTLAARTGVESVAILPGGIRETLLLPGGRILLNRVLVEDFEDPHVAAGYILAEMARSTETSALEDLLHTAGLRGTASLLTTGSLPEKALDAHAESTMARVPSAPSTADLLARFEAARLSTAPYAYAVDISGEATLPLIEADPMSGVAADPIMRDSDWLRLQSICET